MIPRAMLHKLGARRIDVQLIRGAGGAFATFIAGIGISFCLHLFLARSMGAVPYGMYIYVFTWLSLLALCAKLGFDTALLRYVAAYCAKRNWGALRGILRLSAAFTFLASLMLAVALAVVVWALQPSLSPVLAKTFWIGCFLLPLLTLTGVRQAVLRALKHVVAAQLPESFIQPLLLGGLALLTVFGFSRPLDGPLVMGFTIAAAAVAYLVGAVLLRRHLPAPLRTAVARYDGAAWVAVSFPLLFVSGMHLLLNYIDTLMIGVLQGTAQAGVYAIAARVSMLILFGMQAVNMIAAPMIAQYHATKRRSDLQRLVSQIARLIFWISLPLVLFLCIAGRWVLQLFGADFAVAYPALVFLAIGQLVNISMGPVGFLLTMTGNQRTSVHILCIALGVNVLLNIPGILWFGIAGAAAATGFSIALRNILMWRAVKRLLGVDASLFPLFTKS